jgi:protein-tyrosine phosphatase
VVSADYSEFDLLVAMDRSNLHDLRARAPDDAGAKIRLLLEDSPGGGGADVPDPYLGEATFEETLDRIADGCRGLLAALRREGVL